MTRITQRYFVATALCVAVSGAAFAGDMSAADKIKKMDTDSDGKVSAAEHEAGARQMFAMMDADKDGSVTAAEMEASNKTMAQDDWHKDNARSGNTKSDGMKSKETMPKDDDSGN